jgi:hypothetical protein
MRDFLAYYTLFSIVVVAFFFAVFCTTGRFGARANIIAACACLAYLSATLYAATLSPAQAALASVAFVNFAALALVLLARITLHFRARSHSSH